MVVGFARLIHAVAEDYAAQVDYYFEDDLAEHLKKILVDVEAGSLGRGDRQVEGIGRFGRNCSGYAGRRGTSEEHWLQGWPRHIGNTSRRRSC